RLRRWRGLRRRLLSGPAPGERAGRRTARPSGTARPGHAERPPSGTGAGETGALRGWRGGAAPSGSGVADRRDVEVQLDLVGDQEATGLQRGVPGQAPVGAQDLRLALEADALVAERVRGGTVVLDVDGQRPRGAEDGQVARDAVLAVVGRLDLGGPEGHRRELVRLEEV